VVKQGDTMSAIALKWYGDTSLGIEICKANKLPWHTVTPGKSTLVIPAIKNLNSKVFV
jgi:nucleoid-associated protein YgaU